jgi:1-acyl-sn-glycerol-3-phosphate acyltransferase
MDKYIDICGSIAYINWKQFLCFLGIWKYFKCIVKYLSKFILLICEWKLPTPKLSDIIYYTPKAVIIYPHTTYWDFIIMIFFLLAEPKLADSLICLINQKLYNRFPRLLNLFKCAPATSKETANGGFVESSIQKYKDLPKYKILISPEGALRKCEWRSGYYWLAKGLNIPIIIIGKDYSTHMLKYGGTFQCTDDLQKDQSKFQEIFKDIVPLYPECSYVQINKPHHPPSAIGYLTLTAFLSPLPTLYYLAYIASITCIILSMCAVVSVIYHYYAEHYLKNLEPIIIRFGIFSYFMTLFFKERIKIDLISLILWSAVIITYHLGSGRKGCEYRSCAYNRYHFYFHIFSGLATVYMLI